MTGEGDPFGVVLGCKGAERCIAGGGPEGEEIAGINGDGTFGLDAVFGVVKDVVLFVVLEVVNVEPL